MALLYAGDSGGPIADATNYGASRDAVLAVVGSLFNSGSIKFYTADDEEILSMTFPVTAFSRTAAGVFSVPSPSTNLTDTAPTGTHELSYAVFFTSGAVPIYTATIGLSESTADIKLSSVTFSEGDVLQLSSLSLTA